MSRIYRLSEDPDKAVQWLTDADMIRMPIEIGQILLTVWHRAKPGTFSKVIEYPDSDPWLEFASASTDNYVELWNLGMDAMDEHDYRFGSRNINKYRHGMTALLNRLQSVPPLPEIGLTEFPLTPEQTQLAYNTEGIFNSYTHREVPEWKE